MAHSAVDMPERHSRWMVWVAAFWAVACHSGPGPEEAQRTRPAPVAPTTSGGGPARAPEPPHDEFAYVERVTAGASPEDRLPLVVALHGLGDRPENFMELFDGFAGRARIVAPHSETTYSDGYSWFEFRRADPDFSAPGIAAAAERLAGFARDLARRRPTAGRPIAVGFSQGGALSFALAALHAETFAAAFPIGGWFPRAIWPEQKPDPAPSIMAFHGAADTLVPLGRMRLGATRLRELGFPVDVREFDGVGHSISAPERTALFAALKEACEREQTRR